MGRESVIRKEKTGYRNQVASIRYQGINNYE